MIKFQDISKIYNSGTEGEVAALNAINLSVQPGEFVVMLGANGSGKSTLLNILSGSTFPDKGKIFVRENDITNLAEHLRCKWIARVFQNPLAGTASDLSVLENFRLAALRTKRKSLAVGTGKNFRELVKERIADLGLGLENKMDQRMGTLSGGQRQALTLLMAVMDEADILLLDEPTAALDPRTSALIMKIANELISKFNLTAILVTHNLKDAVNYGTRIIQMSDGVVTRDVQKAEQLNLTTNVMIEWFD